MSRSAGGSLVVCCLCERPNDNNQQRALTLCCTSTSLVSQSCHALPMFCWLFDRPDPRAAVLLQVRRRRNPPGGRVRPRGRGGEGQGGRRGRHHGAHGGRGRSHSHPDARCGFCLECFCDQRVTQEREAGRGEQVEAEIWEKGENGKQML